MFLSAPQQTRLGWPQQVSIPVQGSNFVWITQAFMTVLKCLVLYSIPVFYHIREGSTSSSFSVDRSLISPFFKVLLFLQSGCLKVRWMHVFKDQTPSVRNEVILCLNVMNWASPQSLWLWQSVARKSLASGESGQVLQLISNCCCGFFLVCLCFVFCNMD